MHPIKLRIQNNIILLIVVLFFAVQCTHVPTNTVTEREPTAFTTKPIPQTVKLISPTSSKDWLAELPGDGKQYIDQVRRQILSNKKNTAQIENKHIALATTVDKVVSSLGVFPDLIKLDVEGYESFVLKGAHFVLQHTNKPAICIEWNPATLEQCGSSAMELASLLKGYDLYYINDYEFGKKDFLEKIDDITAIPWVCNVFALPPGTGIYEKWKDNIEKIKSLYNITVYQKC